MVWRVVLMFLNGHSQHAPLRYTSQWLSARCTHKWIVTPHPLRSFTLRTLLITSLPKLSKTSTFHIGSPSAFRIGEEVGNNPFALES